MHFYSAIFRGHIRPNAVVGAASIFIQHNSVQLHRSPKLLLKPSSVVRSLHCRRSGGLVTHSQRSRVLSVKAGRGDASSSTLGLEWRAANLPYFQRQNSGYGRIAYNDYESSDESDRDVGSSQSQQMAGSTLDNIDQWRLKLTMLLRNKEDQEVVSRERKDRRDFDHISAMATRMGLHSRQYSKIVVISKAPLPNYRPDLDDKRPQREVVLPFGLQSEVDTHLHAFLDQKKTLLPEMSRPNSNGSLATDYGNYEKPETVMQNSLARERILRPRSLQLRSKQQQWVDSPEGQKMVEFRKTLPAYKEKDALLKAIAANQVVVVSGETGCGKTTQLPQYILESEIEAARGASCSIICTQPRRISAISVSERVAAERGEQIGDSVGYKVRLEGMTGRDTRLLFCTTGVLLRRLLVDRSLKGVTHVVVDEIHERGMNEDFLLIVLKDLLPRRPDLKLILMSATLNAELFSSYFGGAPAMHIPGFTYPVRAHFLEDYLETSGYRLTTYNQIDDYGEEKTWKMQKQAQFKKRKSPISSAVEDALEAADFKGYNFRTRDSLSCWSPDSIGFNLIENVLCHIVKGERPGAVLVFMTGWDDINSLKNQLEAHSLLGDPNKVLLLACHGSMASSEQRLIFDRPPEGIRKIVLATNMAETSITINDVVYVIDCGKAKETSYDALNNTPCLLPSWISKAAARQRRGRAGRVMPGECYHLYPRCVYDAFADYQQPELLRTPLQSLCLQIKSLGLGSISEFLSRALQPPEALSVQNAVEYLKIIGALDDDENLTALGKNLSMLPVEPKLGKMLILGAIFNCLDPVMTVVAGLSVRDPFLMPFDKKDLAETARSKFSGRDYSDHLTLVRAYSGWKDAERTHSGYEYCWKNFLSSQTLKAMDSMRKQFFNLLKEASLIDNIEGCSKLSHDEHLVRAIICAGLFPGICSVVNKEKSITLKTMEDGQVLLYSSSVNGNVPRIPFPWLVFNDKVKVNSVFLRDSTAVSDSVLLLFGDKISSGGFDGHLKMLGGYLEFFMKPTLAYTYLSLKRELDELIQNKLVNPKLDIQLYDKLMTAIRLLVSEDQCEGRFVYGRKALSPTPTKKLKEVGTQLQNSGGENNKNQLQTLLARAGHGSPVYKTRQLKNNQFRAMVTFNGLDFMGKPCGSKKNAEKDAAHEALLWLQGESKSSLNDLNHMSILLKKNKSKKTAQASTKWG
ncbi:unnamed protein product [Arabidopsis lyrata]|uniref:RNA helicase n=1 Tax=Arabidopsis lyrata subsp. lyrata TaxID=81972 RepID=D7KD38_ARALL|nr:DExH-box ATP-dependent RNA helicase DExH3 [Arabidopsis lyrata subsp. lyrata]EFH70382.1 helicase domain-containing protein [Arabidopsis lyrata subsp. lyrata]CAH8254939.1 unnamed protein product [Arabidopsis lyrata]|eukprot:XP_002894123.1 DExH-box ATP-dependent RNA helicase DExH3 [Arabidopsis lyrata subsp. lyrata]